MRRIKHAGHDRYTGAPLHDILKWDVAQEWADPRPASVPATAIKVYGFVCDGVQHVVYELCVPPSADRCDRCGAT